MKPDALRCAVQLGCSVEQAKRLLSKNASQLHVMANHAARAGSYRGYSAAELAKIERDYRKASK